jgi:hypothetical protein
LCGGATLSSLLCGSTFTTAQPAMMKRTSKNKSLPLQSVFIRRSSFEVFVQTHDHNGCDYNRNPTDHNFHGFSLHRFAAPKIPATMKTMEMAAQVSMPTTVNASIPTSPFRILVWCCVVFHAKWHTV